MKTLVAITILAGCFAFYSGYGLSSAGGVMVALDADPSGNTVRSVGDIDDCRSLEPGESGEIDIVIPSPGMTGRGLSAYQFSLLYDRSLVSVTASAPAMLIEQAAASNVLYFSDPLPDTNGVYVSWAVDFGPTAEEPAGASEKGEGILARVTVTAKASGTTELRLSEVQLIDSESDPTPLAGTQNARLEIGQSCPGEAPAPTPVPSPATRAEGETGSGQTGPGSTSAPASGGGASVPQTGGPPGEAGGGLPLLALGLALTLTGAAAIATDLAHRTLRRRD
ncbi:MAG TPA: hypothetical protein VMR52_07190 [Dehalococcoidia bacterium]|nr:hypothetical protein [Dehalococcoidia bacterium]